MVLAIVVFLFVTGLIVAAYAASTSGMAARRQLDRRLREVSESPAGSEPADATVLMRQVEGPLPGVDRLLARTRGGSRLGKLIAQSGVRTT